MYEMEPSKTSGMQIPTIALYQYVIILLIFYQYRSLVHCLHFIKWSDKRVMVAKLLSELENKR